MTVILKIINKHVNENDVEVKNNFNGNFKMYSRLKFDTFLPSTLIVGIY